MPDTGAPWNIPYAAPADLVRDWPDLSEDVADAVAAGLSAAGNAGIGSNVVQTVKTDVFTTTSTSFTALDGLSVSITPSTNTNKVLLIVSVEGATSHATVSSIGCLRLMRDSTVIAVGDTAGSRQRATSGISTRDTGSPDFTVSTTKSVLDDPNTTSAVTYSVQVRVGAGTFHVNRTQSDADNSDIYRTISTITAIEVAA